VIEFRGNVVIRNASIQERFGRVQQATRTQETPGCAGEKYIRKSSSKKKKQEEEKKRLKH
jgi:hypothetical protein